MSFQVQALCSDWFPIVYPQYWYEEITSNPRFYSLAAVYDGVIIGLIVAEIKAYSELNKEVCILLKCCPVCFVEYFGLCVIWSFLSQDEDILAPTFGKDTLVAYLLSLGVSQGHRRNGIASLLLDNLISHLTTSDNAHCKALFLHVLTTNSPAIHFYQRHQFKYVLTILLCFSYMQLFILSHVINLLQAAFISAVLLLHKRQKQRWLYLCPLRK